MTKEETIKILSRLKAAFPLAYRNMTKQSATEMVELWADAFANREYEEVGKAVTALACKKPATWTPSIAGILDEMGVENPKSTLALNNRPYPQSFINEIHKFLREEEAAGRYVHRKMEA